MTEPTVFEPAQYDYAAAQIDYLGGGWSVNGLAAKHGIPEPSLRRHIKRNGWVAGNADVKRGLVREAMAGMPLSDSNDATNDLTNTLTNDEVARLRFVAAEQDVADMHLGLTVARACMGKLLAMVDQVDHPKEVKLIVESNKLAVETIRKIRSLDADDVPETSVTVDIGDGFAELRAAFKRRLESAHVPSSDDD